METLVYCFIFGFYVTIYKLLVCSNLLYSLFIYTKSSSLFKLFRRRDNNQQYNNSCSLDDLWSADGVTYYQETGYRVHEIGESQQFWLKYYTSPNVYIFISFAILNFNNSWFQIFWSSSKYCIEKIFNCPLYLF